MRILLDTHAFLWSIMDDPKLSDRARSIFLDADNELLISAVTGFEIAVKYALGKLELAEPPRDFIENRIRNNAPDPVADQLVSYIPPISFAASPPRSFRPIADLTGVGRRYTRA